MQIQTQEHQEIIKSFERVYVGRHDKEPKELWAKGHVYQDGKMNDDFIAYRHGYAAARCEYLQSAA